VKALAKEQEKKRLAYTVKEAAEMLGLSRSRLYEMVQFDEIPYMKIGGKILLPKKEFESWLKARVVMPQKRNLRILAK
jgi:excisionase family DNA binding protein